MIPGLGRSPGEGKGYPLHKGFPDSSVGKESVCNAGEPSSISGLGRSLEKGKATHSSILAWRFHGLYSPWGVKELDMTEQLSLSFSCIVIEIRPPTDSADERLSGKK